MKKAIVLLFITLISCSSGDSTPDDNSPGGNSPGFFLKFKYDGIQYLNGDYYPSWNPLYGVSSNHHFFTINVSAVEGAKHCQITFTKYGDFVSAVVYDNAEGISGTMENYKVVAGENFHFELEAIDEQALTVKGNFSGKLYEDKFDLSSDFVEIEGSFYNQYFFEGPDAGFQGVSAKIDGSDWHSINSMIANANLTHPVYNYNDVVAPGIYTHEFISDDRYRIIIGYENSVGVNNFTDSSTGPFVRLGRYNPVSGTYEDFEIVSGQLVITDYQVYAPYTASYQGFFNFTVINPDNPAETIQVSDGAFSFSGHS
jgi:hypothetical protein